MLRAETQATVDACWSPSFCRQGLRKQRAGRPAGERSPGVRPEPSRLRPHAQLLEFASAKSGDGARGRGGAERVVDCSRGERIPRRSRAHAPPVLAPNRGPPSYRRCRQPSPSLFSSAHRVASPSPLYASDGCTTVTRGPAVTVAQPRCPHHRALGAPMRSRRMKRQDDQDVRQPTTSAATSRTRSRTDLAARVPEFAGTVAVTASAGVFIAQ
jgi:hypothetical protein